MLRKDKNIKAILKHENKFFHTTSCLSNIKERKDEEMADKALKSIRYSLRRRKIGVL